jgi:hypothetical protein
VKAVASSGGRKVEYSSLCAPFDSNADHILIEAWRKLSKPEEEMRVKLGLDNTITGRVMVSRIGVPFASESRWERHGQRQHQKTDRLAKKG